jgi:two-component sensor histidine kinase
VVSLIEAIVAPHDRADGLAVEVSGTDAQLTGKALTSLALLLHELTTNAAKYGALASPQGRLAIAISVDDAWMNLDWTESGAQSIEVRPERKGFGATLEKAALEGLNAVLERQWHQEGLRLSLKMPLERLAGTDQ